MTDRPTPEMDAVAESIRKAICAVKFDTLVLAGKKIECERDELRELYALDVETLRAERDEARDALRRCQNDSEVIRTRLQTVRDEAFGAAQVETADQNITAIEDGITAMRMENQALRDALRARIGNEYCPECRMASGAGHYPSCRHAATEREVMQ